MKKNIIFAVLLLVLALLLVGCSKNGAGTGEPTDTPSESSQKQTDRVISDYKPSADGEVLISTEKGCRIIYADGCFDEASRLYGELMSADSAAYDNIGYYTMVKSDKSYTDDGKLEIHMGMTGSDASEQSREALQTYLDYTVAVIDGKIVINSYSAGGMRAAVDYFVGRLSMGDYIVYVPEDRDDVGKYTDYPAASINIAGVSLSEFSFVYPQDASAYELDNIRMMIDWIGTNTGAIVKMRDDSTEKSPYEILMGKTNRDATAEAMADLELNEYLFKVYGNEEEINIVIAYANTITMNTLIEAIVSEISSSGSVPEEIKGIIEEEKMIVSTISQLRDPCILVDNGVYYAYGTGWVCYRNASGDLAGNWESLGVVVDVPEDAVGDHWAPEVHKYNGKYYMFTTYKSAKTGHRGCTVLRADTPVGPFVEISDGHVTPADWDSIDGTLYIDEEGQPWMVFVHEWTSTDDGIGRMAAAKMSDDLTRLISEPIELFRADDPSWTDRQVTDGCWMYKCETGELLMIWSNFSNEGYCVGIARSDNGKIDGNWSQDDQLLYSKSMTGEYDGGHGMIFYSIAGQMYLSIHSPNSASAGRNETPVFIAIREENGTLVWDN